MSVLFRFSGLHSCSEMPAFRPDKDQVGICGKAGAGSARGKNAAENYHPGYRYEKR